MKFLLSTLIFTTVIYALPSVAVDTQQCPQVLGVQASGFEVTKTVRAVMQETYNNSAEDAVIIGQALKNISASPVVSRKFALTTAKNGKCIYSGGRDMQKIEIYTTKGKNVLYMQTALGPKGILLRVYSNFEFSPGGAVTPTSSASLALALPRGGYNDYGAGGPLVFVGRGKTIRTTVR